MSGHTCALIHWSFGWEGEKEMNPLTPFNHTQMAFKRWLLDKLIPYIVETKKLKAKEKE